MCLICAFPVNFVVLFLSFNISHRGSHLVFHLCPVISRPFCVHKLCSLSLLCQIVSGPAILPHCNGCVFTSALCTFYNYCLPFLYLCPCIVISQLLTLDRLNQPCLYHLPTSESVSQVLPYLVTLSYCTFIQVGFFFFMFFEHCPGRISVVVQMFMLKQFIGVMREPFVDY